MSSVTQQGFKHGEVRIINVLKMKFEKEKSYNPLVVIGPRDVGKTIYVKLAALRLLSEGLAKFAEKSICNVHLPILVSCRDLGKDANNVIIQLIKEYRTSIVTPIKCEIRPLLIIDDAHLCQDINIDIYRGLGSKVVLIMPSSMLPQRLKNLGNVSMQLILPLRFVEVAEVKNPQVRKVLDDSRHFRGEDRLCNLMDIQRMHEIMMKIANSANNLSLEQVNDLFMNYLKHGGTYYGVELIASGRNSKKEDIVAMNFLKTIDKILTDAKAYGIKEHVVRGLLYYLAQHIFEEGLIVNKDELERKVKNIVSQFSISDVRKEDIDNALSFLRQSHIIGEVKCMCVKKDDEVKHLKNEASPSHVKYVFSDPRYAIGAYMHYRHYLGLEEYLNVYREILSIIENEFKEGKSSGSEKLKFNYFLEATAIANVALGAYAVSTSATYSKTSGQLNPKFFDSFVKFLEIYKSNNKDSEVDSVITISIPKDENTLNSCKEFKNKNEIKIAFEVSTNYDKDHVDKCRKIVDSKYVDYCIYAYLLYGSSQDNQILSDGVLEAPLPYALLLM